MGDEEVPHLDVDVSKDNYRKDFLIVLKTIRPDWKDSEVIFKESPKEVSKGLLNTMVRCYRNGNPDDSIMIRVLNNAEAFMSQFMDRRVEVACIKYLRKHDCAPNILATFKTGYCYEFIHGEVLDCLRLREDRIWRRVAEEFAKIHAANMEDIPGFIDSKERQLKEFVDKIVEDYPEKMTDPEKNLRFKKHLPDKETLKKEMDDIRAHALLFESDLVLAHNDTRAENIVWNAETGVARFVDFERIGCNYRGAELSSYFQRFGGFNPIDYSLIPDEEFQLEWIRVYLERYYKEIGRDPSDVTDTDVRRLYVQTRKYELVDQLTLVFMGPLFDEINVIPDKKVDMLGLSIDALKEYYKQKEEVLALQLPEDTKKIGNSK